MKITKILLIDTAVLAFGVVGAAVYLQVNHGMQPCPWCIIQRYLFIAIGVFSLAAAFLPGLAKRISTGLGLLSGLGGIGAASWLLYTKANPKVSCGIDPMETSLNTLPPADWFPVVFRADGLCTTEYPPVFGLDIAVWSLIWFIVLAAELALVLAWPMLQRRREARL